MGRHLAAVMCWVVIAMKLRLYRLPDVRAGLLTGGRPFQLIFGWHWGMVELTGGFIHALHPKSTWLEKKPQTTLKLQIVIIV